MSLSPDVVAVLCHFRLECLIVGPEMAPCLGDHVGPEMAPVGGCHFSIGSDLIPEIHHLPFGDLNFSTGSDVLSADHDCRTFSRTLDNNDGDRHRS